MIAFRVEGHSEKKKNKKQTNKNNLVKYIHLKLDFLEPKKLFLSDPLMQYNMVPLSHFTIP